MIIIKRNDVDNGAVRSLRDDLLSAGHDVKGVTLHLRDLIVEFADNETDLAGAENIINIHSGYNVELAKDALKNRINLHRDYVVKNVFPHDIDGETHYFDADDRSAIRLDGLYATATFFKIMGWPFSQAYRDANNHNHVIDADGIIQLFQSVSQHETNCVFKAVAIKETIDQTDYDTTEIVDAINASELWESTQWP